MGLRLKSMLILTALILISLILTAYTASAYHAASHVYEQEGRLYWPSTPGGSFYPWPHPPLGIQGMMLTLLSEADSQYYRYVIQSGVLLVLTLVMWIIVAWKAWRIRKNEAGAP